MIERLKTLAPEMLQQLPNAVVLSGIECSGKSSFINDKLSPLGFSRFSFDEEHQRTVSSRKELMASLVIIKKGRAIIPKFNSKEEIEDYLALRILQRGSAKTAQMIKNGGKVALDGLNSTETTRSLIVNGLRAYGVRSIACIWMNTPLEVCLSRLSVRGSEHSSRIVTPETVSRHAAEFVPPSTTEGFDVVVEIPFPI